MGTLCTLHFFFHNPKTPSKESINLSGGQQTVRKHSSLHPFSPPRAHRYAQSVVTRRAAEKLKILSIFMLGTPPPAVCPGCSSSSLRPCTDSLVYMLERHSAAATLVTAIQVRHQDDKKTP